MTKEVIGDGEVADVKVEGLVGEGKVDKTKSDMLKLINMIVDEELGKHVNMDEVCKIAKKYGIYPDFNSDGYFKIED